MNEPDIGQAEQRLAAVPDEERRDTFRQIPWSLHSAAADAPLSILYPSVIHMVRNHSTNRQRSGEGSHEGVMSLGELAIVGCKFL